MSKWRIKKCQQWVEKVMEAVQAMDWGVGKVREITAVGWAPVVQMLVGVHPAVI
jgi:hypothetical protein